MVKKCEGVRTRCAWEVKLPSRQRVLNGTRCSGQRENGNAIQSIVSPPRKVWIRKKKASRMLECSGETLRKHILYVVCTLLRAACPFSASKVLKHFSLQYRSCPRSVGAFAAVDAQLHAGQRRVAVRFLLVSVPDLAFSCRKPLESSSDSAWSDNSTKSDHSNRSEIFASMHIPQLTS